jgi:hypothetical protein
MSRFGFQVRCNWLQGRIRVALLLAGSAMHSLGILTEFCAAVLFLSASIFMLVMR